MVAIVVVVDVFVVVKDTATSEAWHLFSGVKSSGANQPCQGEWQDLWEWTFVSTASKLRMSPEEILMETLGKDGKESKLEQIVGVDFAH